MTRAIPLHRWRLGTYALVILVQVVAAGFVASAAGGSTRWLVVAALLVAAAPGVRELIRELTGPETSAGRAVAEARQLLMFLTDQFPALAYDMTGVLTCPDAILQAQKRTALDHKVVAQAVALTRADRVSGALFWLRGGELVADAQLLGWASAPSVPSLASPEGQLIQAVLDEPSVRKVWVEDLPRERSLRARAFAFSEDCASLVAVPIHCRGGTIGVLHLQSPNRLFDERSAEVIAALTQLLAAVRMDGET
jgi:hypothetical protein